MASVEAELHLSSALLAPSAPTRIEVLTNIKLLFSLDRMHHQQTSSHPLERPLLSELSELLFPCCQQNLQATDTKSA